MVKNHKYNIKFDLNKNFSFLVEKIFLVKINMIISKSIFILIFLFVYIIDLSLCVVLFSPLKCLCAS